MATSSSRAGETGARIYARALFETAQESGGDAAIEAAGEALSAFASSWTGTPRLRVFFLGAHTSSKDKRDALERLVQQNEIAPLVGRFLLLLLRRQRLALLPALASAYQELFHQHVGLYPVTLTTAVAMPAERLHAWTESIRRVTGGRPILRHQVRPEILAGAILRVGDLVADGSARTQLARLKSSFIRKGLEHHALQS